MPDPRILTGWGRTAPSVAREVHRAPADAVAGLLRSAGPRGIIARGLGRSYGDAAQNAGGDVLLPLPSAIELDREAGTVRVSAGTSLHDLMRHLLAHGLFVPVTPGTRFVTVGGAIAADIHGKNHHRSGSMGRHVRSLELVTADGNISSLAPDHPDPAVRDRFWATVGGMGLTGVIVSAVLGCIPVETGHLVVDTEQSPDLDAVMTRLQEADRTHTYTVAWIDTTARGRSLGRSVVTLGEHATAGQLPSRLARREPLLPSPPRLDLPLAPPLGLVNRPSARVFNALWFHKAPRRRRGQLQSVAAFFHPLDGVGHWNRVYGPHGFVQYQFVLPDSSSAALARIFETLVEAGAPSFLSVLKRFGPGDPSPLSFPMAGWTLAVDVPASLRLVPLLDELDRMVLDAGGRFYLAKDAVMDAAALGRMYPRLDAFREVRETMDPDRVFQSDLSRRLGL